MHLPPGPRASTLTLFLAVALSASAPVAIVPHAEAGTAHRVGRVTLHLLDRALEATESIDPARCVLEWLLDRLPPPRASYPRPVGPQPAEPAPALAPSPRPLPVVQATACVAAATGPAGARGTARAARAAGLAPAPAFIDPIWSMMIAIPLARRLVEFGDFVLDTWGAYVEAYRRDNPNPERAPADSTATGAPAAPAPASAPAEDAPCAPLVS